MERPTPDDEADFLPDPAPSSDPEPTPRYPKGRRKRRARPETLANNLEVTPLDEEEHIKDGIEIKET